MRRHGFFFRQLHLFHLRAIAQTAQQAGEFLARAAHKRHHVGIDDEAAIIAAFGNHRPDQVGQTFQHIDAHGTLAADAEAQHIVKAFGRGLVRRYGGEPGRGRGGKVREGILDTLAGQRPKREQQPRGRRLQQGRHENRVGAEAHAMLAQLAARILVEGADIFRYGFAAERSEILDQAVSHPAGKSFDIFGVPHARQRRKDLVDVHARPRLKPGLEVFLGRPCQFIARDQFHAGQKRIVGCVKAGDRLAFPDDPSVL